MPKDLYHWNGMSKAFDPRFRVHRKPVFELKYGDEVQFIRCYEVFGKADWRDGPIASRLNLPNESVIALIMDNDQMWRIEAIVPFGNCLLDGIQDPAVELFWLRLPLTTVESELEVRKLGAYPLRLAKWATERLGPMLEDFLASKGLTAAEAA
ncbi:hypothetical protein AB4Z34_21845 [Ensifer sp. 2YAB10]|uniref:hypothetical protein n=1 Tax=unclassified Ensifer TaxID=2633371 RepID=UPI003F91E3C6